MVTGEVLVSPVVLSECSPGKTSTSKLTYVAVGRIQLLVDSWGQGSVTLWSSGKPSQKEFISQSPGCTKRNILRGPLESLAEY